MPRELHSDTGPGWLLDELATAGRENLDAGHVARYDAKEDGSVAAELRLCQALGVDGDSTVVDVGAGTGQFTLAAAAVCARVIAVDVSAVMLARLQAKIAETALENVELVRAGFLTYEHQGPPADLIYSRYAFHHLPDAWKAIALQRLQRALRPGGVLRLWDVVYSFEPAEADARLEAWCASAGEDIEQDWSRAELEEHVRDEHSTFSWLLEPMIERAGLQIEERSYSDDQIFAKYVLRRG